MNDLCNNINYSRYLIFADDIKIFRAIKSPNDCNRLQSDSYSVQGWCTANFMKLNISKTRVISFSRKTNTLTYDYKLCQSSITRTDSIKDLGVFIDSKLQFHSYVDYSFLQCIKILGLVRTLTFSFSSLDCEEQVGVTDLCSGEPRSNLGLTINRNKQSSDIIVLVRIKYERCQMRSIRSNIN
jgi:hypothetical protein